MHGVLAGPEGIYRWNSLGSWRGETFWSTESNAVVFRGEINDAFQENSCICVRNKHAMMQRWILTTSTHIPSHIYPQTPPYTLHSLGPAIHPSCTTPLSHLARTTPSLYLHTHAHTHTQPPHRTAPGDPHAARLPAGCPAACEGAGRCACGWAAWFVWHREGVVPLVYRGGKEGRRVYPGEGRGGEGEVPSM